MLLRFVLRLFVGFRISCFPRGNINLCFIFVVLCVCYGFRISSFPKEFKNYHLSLYYGFYAFRISCFRREAINFHFTMVCLCFHMVCVYIYIYILLPQRNYKLSCYFSPLYVACGFFVCLAAPRNYQMSCCYAVLFFSRRFSYILLAQRSYQLSHFTVVVLCFFFGCHLSCFSI